MTHQRFANVSILDRIEHFEGITAQSRPRFVADEKGLESYNFV